MHIQKELLISKWDMQLNKSLRTKRQPVFKNKSQKPQNKGATTVKKKRKRKENIIQQ